MNTTIPCHEPVDDLVDRPYSQGLPCCGTCRHYRSKGFAMECSRPDSITNRPGAWASPPAAAPTEVEVLKAKVQQLKDSFHCICGSYTLTSACVPCAVKSIFGDVVALQ